jgi:hypothetical protein
VRLLFLVLCGVFLLGTGCRSPDAWWADAAATVAEDLMPRVPAGYTAQVADEWMIPFANATEPLPDAVRERVLAVTGLPLAAPGAMQSRDSTLILLYFFRPREVHPDTVLMLGGWMGLTTGDSGSVWGDDYDYRLDCRRGCRIRRVAGPIHWN